MAWAMLRLLRAPVLEGLLALSLRPPQFLSPATTCKLPRDLARRVSDRELPPPLEGSEILVLFLLSEASDRFEGILLDCRIILNDCEDALV